MKPQRSATVCHVVWLSLCLSIRGRMASMVLMPSTIKVKIFDVTSVEGLSVARFEVLTEGGGPAINQGLVFFESD